MKILCLHQGFELYGSDRSFLLSLSIIKSHYPDCHLTVIIPREGAIVEELERIVDVLLIEDIGSIGRSDMKKPISTVIRIVKKTRAAIKLSRKYDIVYINTVVVMSYILALGFIKVPGIVHVREIPGRIESLIFSAVLRFSRAFIIYNSNNTRKAFYFRKESRSTVILNAVAGFKKGAKPEPLPVKALMIGRINAWKGQFLLIDAIAGLPDKYKENIRVRFVGAAPAGMDFYIKKLKQEILQKNLTGVAEIHPFSVNPEAHYLWANLAVVPSIKPEPFGRVAIEAMSIGTPVIAAKHGGLVEVVEDGINGWFFEPGNVTDLRKQLIAAISDPDEILRRGEQAESTFERKFTIPIYAQLFIVFFNRVLK